MTINQAPQNSSRSNTPKFIRLGGILLCVIFVLLIAANIGVDLPVNDFTMYWSVSKLLLSGDNPYDQEGLQRYQELETERPTDAVLIYYPPWTLILLAPIGLFERVTGQLAWLLLSTAIILMCSEKLWLQQKDWIRYRWLAWLIAFSFGPTFAALGFTGQITPLFLLGLTGFILLIDKPEMDWLTGFCLYFTAIKPQVLYLFFILLFLWAVQQRRWKILAGFAISLIAATGFGMMFDKQIIIHFIETLTNNTPVAWATPTIGTYLRMYFGFEGFWVQFIPTMITSLFAIIYWWRKKDDWNWQAVLPYLLFLSLITSPYTWTYDFVVLIIPLLIGASLLIRRVSPWIALLIAGYYMLLNSAYWWLHLRYSDFYFIWFAPVLLTWFIMTQSAARHAPQASRIEP